MAATSHWRRHDRPMARRIFQIFSSCPVGHDSKRTSITKDEDRGSAVSRESIGGQYVFGRGLHFR
jgi:hypothetical protein